MPTALPSGQMTLADLLQATDEAILAGDAHRARRLLAEAIARCEADGHRRGRLG